MTTLTIHGRLDSTPANTDLAKQAPPGLVVTPKYSAQLQVVRAGIPPHTLEVSDDDFVELELEGGVRLWMRVEQLQEDLNPNVQRGATTPGFVVPPALPLGSPSRGVGEWVIKGLKILGIDVSGEIVDFVKDKVEGQLQPGPGLYRCTENSADDLQPPDNLHPDLPILLFLHGTASTTDGSFGALWEGGANARIHDLFTAYQGQVLAFQHRTLSQSPIENALELVQALTNALPPGTQGTRLHLVSHSRGGLVGELLCRGMREGREPFDEIDFELFAAPERERDRQALTQLRELLTTQQFQIERFLRVACPARGTTLADGRLDRYLSILVNVLGLTPGLGTNPVYDAVSSLLLAVVKKRTEPRELPGLEAMMPVSPTVRMLNRPDLRTRADLHVLGGDIAGKGLWNRLKVFVTDLFYREDHDLVVNTPAMFGGAERLAGVSYWIDEGANVDHFRYFRNPDTAARLVTGLLKPDAEAFHRLEKPPYEVREDDYRKRAVEPQPVVFVLPGIMGSNLKVDGDRVWLDYFDLARGGLEHLRIDAAQIAPDGLVGSAYRDLIRYLAQSNEVIPFAYDWRRSIEVAADDLYQAIMRKLDQVETARQPVRIIAHSMGGLVVRVMLAKDRDRDSDKKVWPRLCKHPGARVIMLGTPNGGSHSLATMLIGRDLLVRQLALLDIKHNYAALLGVISRFDGVLQLLPRGGSLNLYDPAVWKALQQQDLAGFRGVFGSEVATSQAAGFAWPLPEDARLAEARRIRDLIQAGRIDPERMLYVAGCAAATACDLTIDAAAPPGRRVVVHATAYGDGWVPWDTGIPPELKGKTYYMEAEHGDLAATPEAFPALFDLLYLGTTTKLPQTPPARRGKPDETFVLPPEIPAMYPDEPDLVAAALGGSRRRKERAPLIRKVKVRIVHGDLAGARFPVAVGHYEGDTIVSAESYLDRQVDGRLREMNRLGLYPGKLNTTGVFLNDEQRRPKGAHPGAIIVGLGMVGELTPGALTTTFARGTTLYALERLEWERTRRLRQQDALQEQTCVSAPLTTVLIGAGGAGLSIIDSLQSLLRGVCLTNQRLDLLQGRTDTDKGETESTDTPPTLTVTIDEMEVIEFREDLAIQAAKALLELGHSAEFRDAFEINELLVQGSGGRKRAYFDEAPDWWRRMRIETQPDGSLKFEALTALARTETYLQPTQCKLVSSFLSRAVASTASDPELGYTLFELIVPNRLKEHATDRRNLALILDEKSAAYPWELLQDRFDQGARPLSVEVGMIRQLAIPNSREQVVRALAANALVVGDPTASDTSGQFPSLPGAQAEAREVARQLRDAGYEVLEQIGEDATPLNVLNALFARPYQILHLAAHGVFEFPLEGKSAGDLPDQDTRPQHRTVTGMVLGEGIFLTPAEIEQMRFVPVLVFINCCHLGRTEGDTAPESIQYHRLAANVATQLIRMGVRAVIAAGWAVDDGAAKAFARQFYEEILAGRHFGEAVVEARREVYLRYRNTNTWGAYQCYGDPDFALDKRAAGAPRRSEPRLVAPAELRIELGNIAQEAGTEQTEQLRQRLERLVKSMPQEWLVSAATCAALGRAYGELAQYEQAIDYYDRARTLEPADVSIQALEQLANLKGRWAGKLADKPDATVATKPEDLFREAQAIVDNLIDLGATQERLAIRGSLNKRRAMALPGERRKALELMAESYRKAYEQGVEAGRKDVYYPLENWLAADIVLTWRKPANGDTKDYKHRQAGIRQGFKELGKYVEQEMGKGGDFWSMCLQPDLELLRHLFKQELRPADRDAIRKGYLEARKRSSSDRQMDSVRANIAFFERMAATEAEPERSEALIQALKALRESLEA